MTDDNTNGAGPSADNESAGQQGVRMQILTQYVRDLSLENAVAQKGLPAGEVRYPRSACRSAWMPASAPPITSRR